MIRGDSVGISTVGFHHSRAGQADSLSVATEGWHANGDESLNYPRHYPRLRQLGNYDLMYPPGELASGNKQIDLLVFSRALDTADDFASAVRREMVPTTAVDLLPDWERLVGSDVPATDSLNSRRQYVVAKLRARGGLSRRYFRGIVEALGYTYGQGSIHPIWFVEGGGTGNRYFRAGYSRAGERVFSIGTDGVERMVTVFGAGVEQDRRLISMFTKLRCIGVKVSFKNI